MLNTHDLDFAFWNADKWRGILFWVHCEISNNTFFFYSICDIVHSNINVKRGKSPLHFVFRCQKKVLI